MYLKNTPLFIILLVGIITIFSSCIGQPHTKTTAISTIVSNLDSAIWVVYQDQSDNYWFGSNGRGVYFYDGKIIKQFTTKDGLAANQIRAIQEDKLGNIYFDTPDGVSKFDGHTLTTLSPIYLPKNQWKSEPDDLWFKGNGNINGVYRYDGTSLFHLSFPERNLGDFVYDNPSFSRYGTYSIYKDNKDVLWFGTLSAGVFRYDGITINQIFEKELSVLEDGRVPAVRSIIEDKEGNFWLSNTLNRYKIATEKSTTSKPNSIEYEKLKGIEVFDDGAKMDFAYFMSAAIDENSKDLWMVTYSEGVWRYDGETIFHYPIKDGEKKVLLFSMYKDKQGVLWLGTHNAGVLKFNGKTFEKFKPQ